VKKGSNHVYNIIPKSQEWLIMNYVMNATRGVLLRFYIFKHYEKKGVLQLALQFNFWVVEDICNSLYLYVVGVNGEVT